jgi:hypothetical protein
MDLSGIASGLAASSVTQGVDVGVLRAVQNLDQAQAALLFSSIGLGSGVDAFA